MRCHECGYVNQNHTKICVKCGTKLSKEFQPGRQNKSEKTSSSEGTPTIPGGIAKQPAWDASAAAQKGSDFHRCPDCGHYPLKQSVTGQNPCPNCKSTGTGHKEAKQVGKTSGNQTPTSEKKDKAGDEYQGKTIGLADLNLDGERKIILTDIKNDKKIEFDGEQAELNRKSLDPQNKFISSDHARLTFKNGQWFLSDKSSNEATFIQVQGEVPLSSGCKVMIGNKIYRVTFNK